MSAPKRIQLRRTKGWRMPENTVKVSRPTKWGNPYRVGHATFAPQLVWVQDHYVITPAPKIIDSNDSAVRMLEILIYSDVEDDRLVLPNYPSPAEIRAELRGKNLACFCPLTDAQGNHVPCHADVLLELANKEPGA